MDSKPVLQNRPFPCSCGVVALSRAQRYTTIKGDEQAWRGSRPSARATARGTRQLHGRSPMRDQQPEKGKGAGTGVPASTVTPVLVADLLAEGERMPVYVHVIDHPDARVLVDTGMTQLHPAVADM